MFDQEIQTNDLEMINDDMMYNNHDYYQDIYNDDYDNHYMQEDNEGQMFVGENRGASFFMGADDSCSFPQRIAQDDHQQKSEVQEVVATE